METTPEQYANDLIEKHYTKLGATFAAFIAIRCAIIDVENTIEAIECLTDKYYYKEVLTILESKL